jgi:hypothetical protein
MEFSLIRRELLGSAKDPRPFLRPTENVFSLPNDDVPFLSSLFPLLPLLWIEERTREFTA